MILGPTALVMGVRMIGHDDFPLHVSLRRADFGGLSGADYRYLAKMMQIGSGFDSEADRLPPDAASSRDVYARTDGHIIRRHAWYGIRLEAYRCPRPSD